METGTGQRAIGLAARAVGASLVFAAIVLGLFALGDANPRVLAIAPLVAVIVASLGIFLGSLVELVRPADTGRRSLALAVASVALGALGLALGALQSAYLHALFSGGAIAESLAAVGELLSSSVKEASDVWSFAFWPLAFASAPWRPRLSLGKQMAAQFFVVVAAIPVFFLVDALVPHQKVGLLSGLDHVIHVGLAVLGAVAALVLPLALRIGAIVERVVLARAFPSTESQPPQNDR